MNYASTASAAGTMPAALSRIAADQVVTADVRDELRAGREPFTMIMAARREVPEGGALCVRAIFEPVPLYAVMQRQGLVHWTECRDADDWLAWFYAEPAAETAEGTPPVTPEIVMEDCSADNVIVLDVRGMEPPEPMVHTLAALEQLPAGATLVQINVRVPKFLLPQLEERGFSYEIREQDDVVRLFIRRSSDAAT